jgi:hypothetical protein
MKSTTSVHGSATSKSMPRIAGYFAPLALGFAFAGCAPVVPGTGNGAGQHGPVPGLVAADEVWAILSGTVSGPEEAGPIVVIRGYGNTIEYVAASKAISITEPAEESEPVSLGLDFSIASISLADGQLSVEAEFVDWNGREVEIQLTGTICDEATAPGALNCNVQTPELTLVIGGESQDDQGVSFRLVRLESCPKTLDRAAADDSQWAISSVPVLAILLATASSDPAQELPSPILLVNGFGTQVESAVDAMGFGEESQGCIAGPEFGDPIPSAAVSFSGSTLELDIPMTDVDTIAGTTTEVGTCRATFVGQVTYCALWQPQDGGLGGSGEAAFLYRVDGTGERDRAAHGVSTLNHAYIFTAPSEGENLGRPE